VVVLAAAWAHTSPEARAIREARLAAESAVEGPRIDLPAAAPAVVAAGGSPTAAPGLTRADPRAAFAAGAAAMLAAVAVLRKKR
ncbi:MAG: hypothetical protein LT071_04110, partial [Nocardioides sp.]|nr:hypothetical protein [Nocardioides sp.]